MEGGTNSKKSSIRDIFETISLSVISYLEKHPGVKGVEFVERPGAAARDIAKWEQANAPAVLPDDYKSFLQISDGLLLRWSVDFGGETVPLGCMHLNPIDKVAPIGLEPAGDLEAPDATASLDFDDPAASLNLCTGRYRHCSGPLRAFDLDSRCVGGRVALFYPDAFRRRPPQVRFQDAAGAWHFIAASFTDYFRLLLMHLGVPHWQYAFTDVGLDPATQQWFRFLAPERLAIDQENSRRREERRRARQRSRARQTEQARAPASASASAALASGGSSSPPAPSSPAASSRIDLAAIDRDRRRGARPASASAGRPRSQQSVFRSALAQAGAAFAAAAAGEPTPPPAPQRPASASRQRPSSAPIGPR
eukprot:tig00021435_g21417.t1